MSALLVSKDVISKIIIGIDKEFILANDWAKKEIEPALGIKFVPYSREWMTELGQRMLDLNQLAMKHRYGMQRRRYKYKFIPQVVYLGVDPFKALQCWLYQCREGDIPETSKLYQFLNNVIEPRWAEHIMTGLAYKGYDNAEWKE